MMKISKVTYPGKLITVEGSEGAGKSTVMQFIQTYFEQKNKTIVITREPGGTRVGKEIRKLLLHSKEPITPNAELLLLFADRAQHISELILPALKAGQYVLSDRYIDASYAYQGGGRGIAEHEIALLDRWIVDDIYPDLTLLLDIPVSLGLERADQRGKERDRIEQEKIDFFERVRAAYLKRAESCPERIKVIDASEPLPIVEKQLQHVLDAFLVQEKPS